MFFFFLGSVLFVRVLCASAVRVGVCGVCVCLEATPICAVFSAISGWILPRQQRRHLRGLQRDFWRDLFLPCHQRRRDFWRDFAPPAAAPFAQFLARF